MYNYYYTCIIDCTCNLESVLYKCTLYNVHVHVCTCTLYMYLMDEVTLHRN